MSSSYYLIWYLFVSTCPNLESNGLTLIFMLVSLNLYRSIRWNVSCTLFLISIILPMYFSILSWLTRKLSGEDLSYLARTLLYSVVKVKTVRSYERPVLKDFAAVSDFSGQYGISFPVAVRLRLLPAWISPYSREPLLRVCNCLLKTFLFWNWPLKTTLRVEPSSSKFIIYLFYFLFIEESFVFLFLCVLASCTDLNILFLFSGYSIDLGELEERSS